MITFDSLMLNTFIKQEKLFLINSRINKIQQPTRKELILNLRNNGISRQLYININPQMYHLCFMSDENFQKRLIEIPQKPPMFCMLLRKYLQNSKIAKINQPEGERILELFFETYNELGDKIYLCLAIELMGKYSNIILYNTDTNIILGCAHNVGADKSQQREVYGQIPYTYPPEHNSKYFIQQRYGFLTSIKNKIFDEDFNSRIDNYYANQTYKEIFKKLKYEYLTLTNQKLKKCQKSLNELYMQLKTNESHNKYRLYGDLLMGNLYNIKDYTNEANVYDYENNQNISIPLKNSKTIKENANDYYKKYNKSKTAHTKLKEFIEKNEQNKTYYESILYSIEISENINDLKEIKNEISSTQIDNSQLENKITNRSNKQINLIEQIIEIKSEPSAKIYIGKNNKQNDYIVSKLASDDDLWFHTKDCPGSHVLLKTNNPTDKIIFECAKLAKQHSSASQSSKVGVIYTKRKYLRKPPKAPLGYVTYKNEKEIVID